MSHLIGQVGANLAVWKRSIDRHKLLNWFKERSGDFWNALGFTKHAKSCPQIGSHRSTCSLKRKSSIKLLESNQKAQRNLKVQNPGLGQDHLAVRDNQNLEAKGTSLTRQAPQTSQYPVESQGKQHLIKRNHGEEVYFKIEHLSCKKQPLLLNFLDTKNETCYMIKARILSKKACPDKRLRLTSLI